MTANPLMIYIVTKGRVDNQITLQSIPKKWLPNVRLVCPRSERMEHHGNHPRVGVLAQPESVVTIAEKRAWLIQREASTNKILMLDDDLQFCMRRKTYRDYEGYSVDNDEANWKENVQADRDAVRLVPADAPAIDRMFKAIERMLSTYAHGSIDGRYMNGNTGSQFAINTRIRSALAFNTDVAREVLKFNRVEMCEDVDFVLQMLTAGYHNATYKWCCSIQPNGQFSAGGLTGFRTPKRALKAMRFLEQKFPECVKLKPRDDRPTGVQLFVYWKKAAALGDAKRDGKGVI